MPRPGAHRRPDNAIVAVDGRPHARIGAEIDTRAGWSFRRASDGWKVEQHAEVAGDPKSAWVGHAMTLHEQEVWRLLALFEGGQGDGRIPKRTQERLRREGDRAGGEVRVERLQRRHVEYHDSRSPGHAAALRAWVGDMDARDRAYLGKIVMEKDV